MLTARRSKTDQAATDPIAGEEISIMPRAGHATGADVADVASDRIAGLDRPHASLIERASPGVSPVKFEDAAARWRGYDPLVMMLR